MAHILSRIDYRGGDDGERQPVIPLDTLYVIAEGMSKAFGKAKPDQEVVVSRSAAASTGDLRPRLSHQPARLPEGRPALHPDLARGLGGPDQPEDPASRAPRGRGGDEVPPAPLRGHDARERAVRGRELARPDLSPPDAHADPAQREGRAARDPDGDPRGHHAARSAGRDRRAARRSLARDAAQARGSRRAEEPRRGHADRVHGDAHHHPASGSILQRVSSAPRSCA